MAERPAHLKPPAYLSKNPPLPSPAVEDEADKPRKSAESPDPTRYGDWTLNGIAVDF